MGEIVNCSNNGEIKKCYNKQEISGITNVGGILGRNQNSTTIANCYYLEKKITSETTIEGESKKESFMQTEEFVNELNKELEEPVWEIQKKNNGYPTIKDFYIE